MAENIEIQKPEPAPKSDGLPHGDKSTQAGEVKPQSSWLSDTIGSAWGIVADTAGQAIEEVSEVASDVWSALGGNAWTKQNKDGSVSKVAVVRADLVIPPLMELEDRQKSPNATGSHSGDVHKACIQKCGQEAPDPAHTNPGDRVHGPNLETVVKSPPLRAGCLQGHLDTRQPNLPESHKITDSAGKMASEVEVRDGKIFRKDAKGTETEATTQYIRHKTSDGQSIIINKDSGEVSYESADGCVVHSRTGEHFQHIDRRHGVIVNGDGKIIYLVQKDGERRVTIDKVRDTLQVVEQTGQDCSRLDRDNKGLIYTIEQSGKTFKFIMDRSGNQYFQDENATQYWRGPDGMQTIKTSQGAKFWQNPDGRRTYRTASGQEYTIGDNGSVKAKSGDTEDSITKLQDGSSRLSDGTQVMPDGTVVLSDGTRIAVDGTVATTTGHIAHRSGLATFRDGQTLDLKGFHHDDGSEVSLDGSLKIQHSDGTTTQYNPTTKSLTMPDHTIIDPKRTTTPDGTNLNADRSVDISDGTRIDSEYNIAFSDGTQITADGTVTTSDGWSSSASCETSSDSAASAAAQDATQLVASILSKVHDGTITSSDISCLQAALCNLGSLSRVLTDEGNLALVPALMAAGNEVQGVLAKAVHLTHKGEFAHLQSTWSQLAA
ncbi:MAG: hypothetical protein HY711_00055 [Candidatus Melainabacteria bacterium]|nr:hypothetical protein [Candidatus Melainabacteria bacterium]